MKFLTISAILLALAGENHAFQSTVSSTTRTSTTQLEMDRRQFGASSLGWAAAAAGMTTASAPANAEVFFDPAMYGDQEMRVGTVDTVRERTRRAILQKPALAPSFYQLAILDGLSFNAADSKYGPNGGVIYAVLNTKADGNEYLPKKAAQ